MKKMKMTIETTGEQHPNKTRRERSQKMLKIMLTSVTKNEEKNEAPTEDFVTQNIVDHKISTS